VKTWHQGRLLQLALPANTDIYRMCAIAEKQGMSLIFLILLSINLLIRRLKDCAHTRICDTMLAGGFPAVIARPP
jgi:hypothetical protein